MGRTAAILRNKAKKDQATLQEEVATLEGRIRELEKVVLRYRKALDVLGFSGSKTVIEDTDLSPETIANHFNYKTRVLAFYSKVHKEALLKSCEKLAQYSQADAADIAASHLRSLRSIHHTNTTNKKQ